MKNLRKLRGGLYRIARILGDINAVSKGPAGIVKRIVNKVVGRKIVKRMWWK